MNRENTEHAIAIMERARGKVQMTDWQTTSEFDSNPRYVTSEAELHQCGNTACFAGWVALSHEFREWGGSSTGGGVPRIVCTDDSGADAIKRWLDISEDLAESLVFGDTQLCSDTLIVYSLFYDKPWDRVEADDVIEKLKLILSGELK